MRFRRAVRSLSSSVVMTFSHWSLCRFIRQVVEEVGLNLCEWVFHRFSLLLFSINCHFAIVVSSPRQWHVVGIAERMANPASPRIFFPEGGAVHTYPTG